MTSWKEKDPMLEAKRPGSQVCLCHQLAVRLFLLGAAPSSLGTQHFSKHSSMYVIQLILYQHLEWAEH